MTRLRNNRDGTSKFFQINSLKILPRSTRVPNTRRQTAMEVNNEGLTTVIVANHFTMGMYKWIYLRICAI